MAFNPVRPGSIGFRLVVGASLWLVVALLLAFVVLTSLFRATVTHNFDMVLLDHIDEILHLTDVRPDGGVGLRRHPVDPRFATPKSGWYWEISASNGWHDGSRSLASAAVFRLPSPSATSGDIVPYITDDTTGKKLRVVGKRLHLQGSAHQLTILLAGPATVIETAVREFNGALLVSLVGLGFGLIVAVVFQVYYGLRPLRAIGQALAEIRAGRAARLADGFPLEVAPLARELNALLDHNERSIERTRTQVGNLAHALKTPIAVLKNTAERLDGPDGAVIGDQLAAMSEAVDHHLARARVAGTGRVLGAPTPLRPTVTSLRRALAQIYAERGIDIDVDIAGAPAFRGERQDLEEMLGNLMDNACKWCDQRLRVEAKAAGSELLIAVSDDGPGIDQRDRQLALDRGRRLDETTPGSGLGLSIVEDIAELYGGQLTLIDADLGGVAAQLRLPAA